MEFTLYSKKCLSHHDDPQYKKISMYWTPPTNLPVHHISPAYSIKKFVFLSCERRLKLSLFL